MRTRPEPEAQILNAEQCAKGTILVSMRSAAKLVWGEEGVAKLAKLLPREVRENTIDRMTLSVGWYPERYVLSWWEAAYAGPAGNKDAEFFKFLDVMMELGFGRVRRFLLKMASPRLVLEKAADLWSHDHSAGTLESVMKTDRSAELVLRDHIYATKSLSRSALAEIYRFAISLTGVNPKTKHALRPDGTFVVSLEW
jgi:hypothetical protein